MLTFGSLFSGIGGFDLGFEQAGMECAWQVEYDAKARSVLQRHWPDAALYNDVHHVYAPGVHSAGGSYLEPVDLVCGGFPCQDLSVAGKRAGLAGERSGLWFEFHRILTELRPQWVVIENVPGLLSSNRGADFAVILQGLVELRYGVSWRILDAQYFGVAQRRRRVFIVGSLGDGRSARVLFEREGLFGHPPARKAQGQSVTPSVANGINNSGLRGRQPGSAVSFVADTLTSPGPDGGRRDKNVVSFDWQAGVAANDRTEIMDKPGRTRSLTANRTLAVAYNIQQNDGGQHRRPDRPEGGMYVNETDTALTVGSTDQTVVAASLCAHHGHQNLETETFVFEPRFARNGRGAPDTIAPPLKAQNGGTGKGDGAPVVIASALHSGTPGRDASDAGNGHLPYGVRRLTPTECERLQGFPDGWTAGQSDSARYRQLGNAVAVPVARWIGQRITEVSHA